MHATQGFSGGGRPHKQLRLGCDVFFNNFEKIPQKSVQKAFSIAEAMITLLIVSLALAAAAPIMSKQIKNSQVQQVGIPSGMVSFFNIPCNSVRGGWSNVPAEWQGRYPRIAGAYDICDRAGEWKSTDSDRGGNAIGACKTVATNGNIAYGEFQGDAIRNIEGETRTEALPGGSTGPAIFNGAFEPGGSHGNHIASKIGGGNYLIRFNSSLVVPTADENRVKTVGLYMCVKN